MGLFDIFFKQTPTNETTPPQEVFSSDFSNFEKVVEYLYQRSGITDLDKRALSISALHRFAAQEMVVNTQEFLNRMKTDKEFYQNVLNIITVNESFFFREIEELKWLVTYIKNASNQKIRLLSLPCSTGEEVYSILMLLDQEGVNLNKVEIIGFDINTDVLTKAKEALYNGHSLHKVSNEMREKYFAKQEDDSYQLNAFIREKARFEQKNIFELQEDNLFDVVLSRNMFIYFDATKRKEATNILVKLVKDGGYFIKGHADAISKHPSLINERYGIFRVKKV